MVHFLSEYMLAYGDSNTSLWIVAAYAFVILAIVITILCHKLRYYVFNSLPCFIIEIALLFMALACVRISVTGTNKASVKNIKNAITSEYADAAFINAEAKEGQFTHDNKICRYTVTNRKITVFITTDNNGVETQIIE